MQEELKNLVSSLFPEKTERNGQSMCLDKQINKITSRNQRLVGRLVTAGGRLTRMMVDTNLGKKPTKSQVPVS